MIFFLDVIYLYNVKDYIALIPVLCTKTGISSVKNRVSITVLCNLLLKQLDNGAYEPKKIKREKVKEVLLSFRRSLRNVGSECIECNWTTFDYV